MKTLRNCLSFKVFVFFVSMAFLCAFSWPAFCEDGDPTWVNRYSGPAGGQNSPTGIAVDGGGSAYVTGYSYTTTGVTVTVESYDFATIKYDKSGKQAWVNRYGGPTPSLNNSPTGIAVDGSGSTYVTGSTVDSSTGWDYTTIKYDKDSTSGMPAWIKRYLGPGKEDDRANAVATDGGGNVYVTGYAYTGNVSDTANYDFATIKYDKSGKQAWVSRYSGLAPGYNTANAIAVDGPGNVYVTGSSQGQGQYESDFATIKYDKNGKQAWVSRYAGPKQKSHTSPQAVDSFDEATSIAVDGSGNVYVAGKSGNQSYAAIKYSAAGAEQWVKRYDSSASWEHRAIFIGVDKQGNAYVTMGSPGQGYDTDIVTIKHDGAGNVVWTKRYAGPKGHDSPTGMVVLDDGSVYITGKSLATDGIGYEYVTLCYAGLPATTTTLTSSPNPSPLGTPVTLTATVAADATTGATVNAVPTGTVDFYDGSEVLQQNVSLVSGTAEYVTSSLVSGIHTITAVYSGDDSFGGSTGVLTQTVGSNPPVIIVPSAVLPDGEVKVAYPAQTLTVTGGTAPYRWAPKPGSPIPAGLKIKANKDTSTAVISGTPSKAGTYEFSIKVTDKTKAFDEQTLTVTVYSALSMVPSKLPNGDIGVPYSQQLTAAGGSGQGYQFSAVGTLPGWMTVSSGGLVAGTPTASGNYPIKMLVTDSLGGTANKNYAVKVNKALAISSKSPLPPGRVSTFYTQTLKATGGNGGYKWTALSQPVWMVVSETGKLTGTPGAAGSYTLDVQVTDNLGATVTKEFTIEVKAK
jgi:hypothetical protein